MEKYSRGRRGAPAKGVGRVTGAKVQILSSPPRKKALILLRNPVKSRLFLFFNFVIFYDILRCFTNRKRVKKGSKASHGAKRRCIQEEKG